MKLSKNERDDRKTKCEGPIYKGYWDAVSHSCVSFYVLQDICILINAEEKDITKHQFANEKMSYGCVPGIKFPNSSRDESPWNVGIYVQVNANTTHREPIQKIFSTTGEFFVRDWNDPWVIGQYITNGESFTPVDIFVSNNLLKF